MEFVAETFGDLVGGWQPINETNYYARAAYGGRGWPPGHDDNEEVAFVNEAIHLAFAEASVRLKQTGAPVASIFGLSPIVTQDDSPATAALADRSTTTTGRPGSACSATACSRFPIGTRSNDPTWPAAST